MGERLMNKQLCNSPVTDETEMYSIVALPHSQTACAKHVPQVVILLKVRKFKNRFEISSTQPTVIQSLVPLALAVQIQITKVETFSKATV